MDNVLDKARGGQNALEKLVGAIPGFKGYQDKELRRDADQIQREYMATRLEQNKGVLNDIANAATRGGDLGAINDIETARKRLDKVVARLRFAQRGYAGFFDAVKVDEAMLARIYEFDLSLIQGVESILTVMRGAASAPSGPGTAIHSMLAEIEALDLRLNDRESMLRGVN
jgi:hypothetical protein